MYWQWALQIFFIHVFRKSRNISSKLLIYFNESRPSVSCTQTSPHDEALPTDLTYVHIRFDASVTKIGSTWNKSHLFLFGIQHRNFHLSACRWTCRYHHYGFILGAWRTPVIIYVYPSWKSRSRVHSSWHLLINSNHRSRDGSVDKAVN